MIAARHCTADALARLLRGQPLSHGKVSLAWRTAAGPAVARVTSAALGPDGVLAVTAADAHWTRELRRSQRLLTTRLNRLLGDGVVTRIDVSSRTTR